MKNICALIIFLFFIQSCGLLGIHDPTKRNEHWAWFIDKDTGKGKWVKVEGDEITVEDGDYTMFYHSGKIFQKGRIANKERVDTVWFFDVNQVLIKYTVLKPDSNIDSYVNNGPYTAYSQMGEIFEEGVVINHRLENIKWHGAFGHYLEVMDAIDASYVDMHAFDHEMHKDLKECARNEDSIIAEDMFQRMDSLNLIARNSAKQAIEKLNQVKTFNESPYLQRAVLARMILLEKVLGNEFEQILTLLKKDGFSQANQVLIPELVKGTAPYSQSETDLEREIESFQLKFNFTEEQEQLIVRRYPGIYFRGE
jgi:hypothetical protein